MSKKLRKKLWRIVICLIAYIAVLSANKICEIKEVVFFEPATDKWLWAIPFLAVFIAISFDIIKNAVRSIVKGLILDENFLMVIASIGAFLIGSYSEGVAVMLFYQVGEWFQSYAVGKSRKSIKELMDIRPDYANVYRDGVSQTVDPDEVSIGETIIVNPGEKIPLDGVVIEGSSNIDTSSLTGESLPRFAQVDDEVISGCVNLSGVIKVSVTKEFQESTVNKILELMENATEKKAASENFIHRFALRYTPIVCLLALALAVLGPIITKQSFIPWLYRALEFLVISCPCALVISVPLGFFGGIGGAGRVGILVKGSSFIELLGEADIVAMDKTGTLTSGVFCIEKVTVNPAWSNGADEDARKKLLQIAAAVEKHSTHPIAQSIVASCDDMIGDERISDINETAGKGVSAVIDDIRYYVGNKKMLDDMHIDASEASNTAVYVSTEGEICGIIELRDEEKSDAAECVRGLKKAGVSRVVMLTGDAVETAKDIATRLGIDEYYAKLLPTDKVSIVEQLLSNLKKGKKLVFVGDGINDAPVLARADVGIAMGGLGSDAAIEAADVVLMTDEPSKLVTAMRISKRTLRIVRENIVFAIGVKILILILAACGVASMWAAVFADVGVAFIAILNALRAMKVKQ